MTFEQRFGKRNCNALRKRLEELFQSESGFIFIGTHAAEAGKKGKLTDAFHDTCGQCVVEAVIDNVKDADRKGLLSLSCRGKYN